MSPHGIARSPDQSLRNSGNKRHLAKPLTLPDFIAISQTVYEKSVTQLFYTLHYFGVQGDLLGQS